MVSSAFSSVFGNVSKHVSFIFRYMLQVLYLDVSKLDRYAFLLALVFSSPGGDWESEPEA
jgi:hypothetical protein